MSHLNKPQIQQTFEEIKGYLKGAVPPCKIITDAPTHFECVADNGEKEILFGYAVAHHHVVTLGFYDEIPANDKKELFSERLLNMMKDNHNRIEIRNIFDNEFGNDIRDAITKLLYYYNQKGYTK